METALVRPSEFKPALVEAPSASLVGGLETGLVDAERLARARVSSRGVLPGAAQAVRLKLNAVQVVSGLEPEFLGLGAPKGIYLVSSIVDGIGQNPITFEGKTYTGVRNGNMLPLGTEGERDATFNLYQRTGGLPDLLCFSLVVFRSNENLREFGGVLTEMMGDSRFTKLYDIVKAAVSGANPAFGIVWQAANEIIGLLGSYLKAKPDEQLGYYEARYTRIFDDLGVGEHPPKEDRAPTLATGSIRLAYEINVA